MRLWNLLKHGRIEGNVGWCGQQGYWWVKPCPHFKPELAGCGWYSAQHQRILSHDAWVADLAINQADKGKR